MGNRQGMVNFQFLLSQGIAKLKSYFSCDLAPHIRQSIAAKNKWILLSAVRFSLAVWVLFAHTYNFGEEARAIWVPSRNALVAVYCFLAVSGFSIHHSITARASGYMMRRFRRIVPIHIVSLCIALAAYGLAGDVIYDGFGNPWPFPSITKWIACALLLQIIFPVAIAVLFPAWSLSAEIVFYTLAPFLLKSKVRIPFLLIIGSEIFCVFRQMHATLYVGSDYYLIPAIAMLWAWLAGWIAYSAKKNIGFFLFCGQAGSVAIFADAGLSGWFNHAMWWSVLAIAFFDINFSINHVVARMVTYLGELSYPIYLLNYPIFFLLFNTVFKAYPDWNNGVTLSGVVFLASMLLYHGFDKPIRSMRINRQFVTSVAKLKPQIVGWVKRSVTHQV